MEELLFKIDVFLRRSKVRQHTVAEIIRIESLNEYQNLILHRGH